MDELVSIVDEQRRSLREAFKSEAHAHGWLHAVVIGYVRHGERWTLVRQTPDRQDAGQLVAPERFGEALYFVFESFYPHMLPSTWQRRWS